MRRSTAHELSVEARRARVGDLFLKGVKRQDQLAERLGVDRSTISRDLKVLNARWKESGVRDLDAAKGQVLEEIDLMRYEAWSAWEASKAAKETTSSEQVNGRGGRSKAAIRTEQQTGDPRYLAAVQWCITKTCDLLGLDAPKEFRDVTDAQVDAEVQRLLGDVAAQRQAPAGGPPAGGGPEHGAAVPAAFGPPPDLPGGGDGAGPLAGRDPFV